MTSIAQVTPDRYDDALAAALGRVVAAAAEADERIPLNEAALLSLRHRGIGDKLLWVARDEADEVAGFALVTRPGRDSRDPVEGSLVVAPRARRTGLGRSLAAAALEELPGTPVSAWSHGNHPAAASLAEAFGFLRARDLWVMRRPLGPEHPLPEVVPAGGVVVRTFRPGQDEDAFLAVNAEAFIDHPEQGTMTRADLEERMVEPWFDPEGFFLAEPADAPPHGANEFIDSPSLLGFHWTKVHRDNEPPVGEVYVVGVSPAAQGMGLGKVLTLTGLHHLRSLGLPEVILYVEADNAPAVAVYSGLGFTHAEEDTDVQYLRS